VAKGYVRLIYILQAMLCERPLNSHYRSSQRKLQSESIESLAPLR
jgi:hypothetical protein